MFLREKFPTLRTFYASGLNDVSWQDKHYSSTEKLYWVYCDTGHTCYKTALEFTRYHTCPTCKQIADCHIDTADTVATLYPELAQKMLPDNRLHADGLLPSSTYRAHWSDCDERIRVCDRVRSDHRGRSSATKGNTVADLYPRIAAMCMGDISGVTVGSNRVFTWKCDAGHTFSSSVRNMIKRVDTCPVCSGLVVQPGVNDIATLYPTYARSVIDPDPTTITASYSGVVTHRCTVCGHTWTAPLYKEHNQLRDMPGCPSCAGKIVISGVNDLATAMPQVVPLWCDDNDVQPQDVMAGADHVIRIHGTCGPHHIITTRPYILTRDVSRHDFVCSSCATSTGEKELARFISTLPVTTITNTRAVIPPYELDIYIPNKRVAVEYNGLYWHSEVHRSKNYHYDKWKMCQDQGIQLITVWEDDWRDRRSLIQSMIAYKLGVSQTETVPARKTAWGTVRQSPARGFLAAHHIQGYVAGCRHYGLYRDDHLVAILSVSTRGTDIVINRYATSCRVPGGFTKLVTHMTCDMRRRGDYRRLVTFSDRMVSDGGLYSRCGFEIDGFIPPDYQYVYRGVRCHKSLFRKQRFVCDPELRFEDGRTEHELALINHIYRAYDAGKVRWAKNIV